jgi:hypothetical protein
MERVTRHFGTGVGEGDPDGEVEVEAFAGVRRDDRGRGDRGVVAGGDVAGRLRERGAGRDQGSLPGVEREPAAAAQLCADHLIYAFWQDGFLRFSQLPWINGDFQRARR